MRIYIHLSIYIERENLLHVKQYVFYVVMSMTVNLY